MRPLHNALRLGVVLTASLALLWVLWAMPLRAQDEEPAMSLAAYRAELNAAIDALGTVDDAMAASIITQLQERFATITRVEYPDGEVVVVTSLLRNLDAVDDTDTQGTPEPTVLARLVALARLRGTTAQIDAAPADNTIHRLQILSMVLARPEFNTPVTLWERFLRWFTNWLSDLLPASGASGSGWLARLLELIPWIAAIVMIAAIIWLLSYWLQRILRSFVADARQAELAAESDLPATAAEARQQARSAAQSGNYRDAVRRLYLAALLQLAEHDLITYERSLTNREVLVRVPADSPIRPHLEPVVTTFDQVWYGVREPDLATFHAYEQEIDELAAVARPALVSHVPTTSPTSPTRPTQGEQ